MPPLSLLIKPASGLCSMRCDYCFYADVAANRETGSYGLMSLETLENVVKKALAYAEQSCVFAFQGGEPTLAGLPFFKKLIALEQAYNTRGVPIHHAIQTNGYGLDAQWASFFARHHFLVGLSVDGDEALHDQHRHDPKGGGTFQRVMDAAGLLTRHGAEFNVLAVVTGPLSHKADQVYTFFKKNGFAYQQYIACLDPLGEEPGCRPWSLTPEGYCRFLLRLFDRWYQDLMEGAPVSIRWFDNLVRMMKGLPPESCGMTGRCAIQNVVEADGSVYPCDFYVLDEYRMGNLNTDGFEELRRSPAALRFLELGEQFDPACPACSYWPLCRGGCRRERDAAGRSRFCQAYLTFFPRAMERLSRAAGRVRG